MPDEYDDFYEEIDAPEGEELGESQYQPSRTIVPPRKMKSSIGRDFSDRLRLIKGNKTIPRKEDDSNQKVENTGNNNVPGFNNNNNTPNNKRDEDKQKNGKFGDGVKDAGNKAADKLKKPGLDANKKENPITKGNKLRKRNRPNSKPNKAAKTSKLLGKTSKATGKVMKGAGTTADAAGKAVKAGSTAAGTALSAIPLVGPALGGVVKGAGTVAGTGLSLAGKGAKVAGTGLETAGTVGETSGGLAEKKPGSAKGEGKGLSSYLKKSTKMLYIVLSVFFTLFPIFIIVFLVTDDSSSSSSTVDASTVKINSDGTYNQLIINDFATPVDVPEGFTFNFNNAYGYGISGGLLHNGIDLNKDSVGVTAGAPVYSIYDGTVIDVGSDTSSEEPGYFVKIEHTTTFNGQIVNLFSYYKGLDPSSVTVVKGDTVTKKQQIGVIDSNGSLHFSIVDENSQTYINPINFFIKTISTILTSNMEYDLGSGNDAIIANYLLSHGFNEIQTAAIMANILSESSYNPKDKNGVPCYGIAQWCITDSSKRGENLIEYAASKGKTWEDFDIQLEFLLGELKNEGDAAPYVGKRGTAVSTYRSVINEIGTYPATAEYANKAVELYCLKVEVPCITNPATGTCGSCKGRRDAKTGERWLERLEKGRKVKEDKTIVSNGQMLWPCASTKLEDKFGDRSKEISEHPSSYYNATKAHFAIDIKETGGFYAVADGTVTKINKSGVYSIHFKLDQKDSQGDDIYIVYTHGDALSGISVGQHLKAGERIGTAGRHGSDNIHLDFAVYSIHDGSEVRHNPLIYLYGLSYDGTNNGSMSVNLTKYDGTAINSLSFSNYGGEKAMFESSHGTYTGYSNGQYTGVKFW